MNKNRIADFGIDDILATAIRNVWLKSDVPGSRSRYYVEIESARRVRAALEQEGLVIHHRPIAGGERAIEWCGDS